jgi:hypothetical protein
VCVYVWYGHLPNSGDRSACPLRIFACFSIIKIFDLVSKTIKNIFFTRF